MADRDGETGAEMLERVLSTPSATELRRRVVDRLDLDPGEAALSIGCGPGYEPAALADAVDGRGRVLGVDVSGETLALARDRCSDLPQVSLVRGDATSLPVPDESHDVAVAKQVYRAVPDVGDALSELCRVLAPGGRAAVVETDADALVIHSPDRDRMRRATEAYRNGIPNPHLGSGLVSRLPDAGLTVERVEPFSTVHREINETVERGIEVHRRFMAEDESFDDAEIEAWERDLRNLAAAGEFLSCGTQFVYLVRKSE